MKGKCMNNLALSDEILLKIEMYKMLQNGLKELIVGTVLK